MTPCMVVIAIVRAFRPVPWDTYNIAYLYCDCNTFLAKIVYKLCYNIFVKINNVLSLQYNVWICYTIILPIWRIE